MQEILLQEEAVLVSSLLGLGVLWLLLLRNKSPENGAAYSNSHRFTLPLSLGVSGVWEGRGGGVLGPRSGWSGATGAGAVPEALAPLPPRLGLAALPSPKGVL